MNHASNPGKRTLILLASALWLLVNPVAAQEPVSPPIRVVEVKTFVMPTMSLAKFGNPAVTKEVLDRAKRNGLKHVNLPSIGSGLARVGESEFFGVTDRGPNGSAEGEDTSSPGTKRTFPLPEFCPSIVRFRLSGGEIKLSEIIPLRDGQGRRLTGLNNSTGEEPLFASPDAAAPLAPDPDGVDPEGIKVLPDGRFILVEEYSPSIFIVSASGEVLMRYTPASKPLSGATYPVKPILPDVFAQRRVNHGFENIAVSGDGRTAYAILQCPMGDAADDRYQESRAVRVLRLDISDPLSARVTGEFLMLTSRAGTYPGKQKQDKTNTSDAEWLRTDQLLVIERGKAAGKLLLVDFRDATNIFDDPRARDLTFENVSADLAALGVRLARSTEIFSTATTPQINSVKLEGLALAAPDTIALSDDNDFGIGDNKTGTPSKVWLVKFNRPL